MKSRVNPTPLVVAIIALLAVGGCDENLDTPEKALAWLSSADHGLVCGRKGTPVSWKVRYLPNDYLAWRYLQSLDGYEQVTRDSILKSYDNTLCFLLTVTPGEKKENDVIMQGVGSLEDFQSRVLQLNFNVKDLVRLRYGNMETPAVISTMENTYGMEQGRNIMVIFAKDEVQWRQADTLDVVLDDRIYNSGIHHFGFLMEDIRNIPPLEIPTTRTNK